MLHLVNKYKVQTQHPVNTAMYYLAFDLQIGKYFSFLSFSTPVGYRNPLWAKTGRELRMLADAFSKTKERERVRRRADEVRNIA